MKTVLDPACYARLLTRFRGLSPDAPARWGRMNAPRMLAHLCDQMRHTLGDTPVVPHRTVLHWPVVKQVVMYWLPWPKARIKGLPEAFLTPPTTWHADLAMLNLSWTDSSARLLRSNGRSIRFSAG